MSQVPRLRIFAGPNGSGKSTMKEVIGPELLGIYINPDDIEKDILKHDGILDLKAFGIETSTDDALSFFQRSSLLANANLLDVAKKMRVNDSKLNFSAAAINSYFASVASDFIRRKLVDQRLQLIDHVLMVDCLFLNNYIEKN